MSLYQVMKTEQASILLNLEAIESVEFPPVMNEGDEALASLIMLSGAKHTVLAQSLMIALDHAEVGVMTLQSNTPEDLPEGIIEEAVEGELMPA